MSSKCKLVNKTNLLPNKQRAPYRISQTKSRLQTERLVPPYEDCLQSIARDSFMRNLSTVMMSFDWKQHQHFLNTFKQYRTEIEGILIHFLRISIPKEKGRDTVPILLLHGYPGSYWDFFKVIPILTNPTRFGFDFGLKKPIQFEVIVPSLPGFLFSTKPARKGISVTDIARIAAKLMERLDVNSYFVHGSEWLGSEVAISLASMYQNRVQGLHVSNPLVHPKTFSWQVTVKYLMESFTLPIMGLFGKTGDFLDNIPRILPSSDAVEDALSTSPLGTASYLMSAWSLLSTRDPSVLLNDLYTFDELATVSYLYYLTQTTPHALRIMNSFVYDIPSQRILYFRRQVFTPVAILQSPQTPWYSSQSICRHRFLKITSFTETPRGGAFQHLQDPTALAADIFRFVEMILMKKLWYTSSTETSQKIYRYHQERI
ncbi:hydrolase, alpha/beta domain protein [Necator americanus]|uniref:Epoxide hydrolase n=1 Tax=Necator americanus TaxID=51031 RepID=W2TMK3_NECAM|nr:hydrolase, alpha/beta domain protein [Necator americanus]ETN82884.1 hydrolase, alpha/beta domain protein [Necator americanus]